MKVLTLYQPWASLVACGAKKIETRSWNTKYRGELLIHASKSTKYLHGYINYTDSFYGLTKIVPYEIREHPENLPRGAIIAICILRHTDLILDDNYAGFLNWEEREFGDFTPGRYAWHLDRAKPLLEPIYCKGALGLWEWSQPSS